MIPFTWHNESTYKVQKKKKRTPQDFSIFLTFILKKVLRVNIPDSCSSVMVINRSSMTRIIQVSLNELLYYLKWQSRKKEDIIWHKEKEIKIGLSRPRKWRGRRKGGISFHFVKRKKKFPWPFRIDLVWEFIRSRIHLCYITSDRKHLIYFIFMY